MNWKLILIIPAIFATGCATTSVTTNDAFEEAMKGEFRETFKVTSVTNEVGETTNILTGAPRETPLKIETTTDNRAGFSGQELTAYTMTYSALTADGSRQWTSSSNLLVATPFWRDFFLSISPGAVAQTIAGENGKDIAKESGCKKGCGFNLNIEGDQNTNLSMSDAAAIQSMQNKTEMKMEEKTSSPPK